MFFLLKKSENLIQECKKLAEEYNLPLEYVVETKIDGLSTALEYKNGIFLYKKGQQEEMVL